MKTPPRLTQGRIERAAKLARMGAATGLGALTGTSAEKLAAQAAEVLGSLRGMATKVGQIASTVEGVLPESLQAPVASAMARLRDQAAISPFPEIVQVIEAELGAPMASLFRDFAPTPMASASIGQVHAATLLDGRELAVKVQHPGIERAMESDLGSARLFERLASSLIPKGFEPDRTFDDVAARFREELDYRLEAQNQLRFSKLHCTTPGVFIPSVIATHSTRRVLSTDRVQGKKLEQVLLESSSNERRGYAETLYRFVYHSVLVEGEFNADPHPGNYFFGDSPNIVFLDFGCVQALSPGRHRALIALHQAACDRNEVAFAEATRALLMTRGGALEDFVIAFMRRVATPLFESPFRLTRDFVRKLFEFTLDGKLSVFRERQHAMPFPAELALLNRLQIGLFSVLARLDVDVDYAALERQIMTQIPNGIR